MLRHQNGWQRDGSPQQPWQGGGGQPRARAQAAQQAALPREDQQDQGQHQVELQTKLHTLEILNLGIML